MRMMVGWLGWKLGGVGVDDDDFVLKMLISMLS